jgi:PIN domain nuclease of toxin-antitoxin system
MKRGLKCLLDTHAALWAQLEPARLGRDARSALTGLAPAAVAISDVTLSETGRLLWEKRVVPGKASPARWLDAFGLCFTVLPVDSRIAWVAASFDWAHRDPCDRHILATAAICGLPLLTTDPAITAFAPTVGVQIVWK